VNSKRFVAKTSVSVGVNTPNTTYALYVNGTGNFTGAVSATSLSASNYISANSSSSGSAGGLSLYGTTPTEYGIAMRTTAT